jgi:hypothetical protein
MPNTRQLKMTDSTAAESIFVGIFPTISRNFSDNSTIAEEREAYALAKSQNRRRLRSRLEHRQRIGADPRS